MANLVDIQQQIEKLQKQAKDIKAREFERTVQDILGKMQAFGITLNDLRQRQKGSAKTKPARQPRGKARGKSSAPKAAGSVVAAKYRGPNGETWSGRGLVPRWLSSLVAQGQAKESFLIQP